MKIAEQARSAQSGRPDHSEYIRAPMGPKNDLAENLGGLAAMNLTVVDAERRPGPIDDLDEGMA